MQLLYLDEVQNEAFDYEYHTEDELARKLAYVRDHGPANVTRILDVGGGNGKFMDRMLREFPEAQGWVVDISRRLLDTNAKIERKHLIHGSFEDIADLVGDERFDVITINWVLHHLVGPSYGQSVRNAEQALKLVAELLAPGGMILVAENEYQGVFETNWPSHIIYGVTRITCPAFVRLAGRYFNTAGVGVCFQSQRSWEAMFKRLNMRTVYYQQVVRWDRTLKERLMFLVLGLRVARHGHFGLQPGTQAVGQPTA